MPWLTRRTTVALTVKKAINSAAQVGTETPPEEIQQQLSTLKQRNEVERNKVDQIFTERANWESRTKEVDTQVRAPRRPDQDAARNTPNTQHPVTTFEPLDIVRIF